MRPQSAIHRISPARRTRSGFTLVEMLIALTVLALVVVNITSLVRTAGKAFDSDAASARLEEMAARTMDRVVIALAGASRNSLTPANAMPLSNPEINFRSSLGMEDGVMMLGTPERIELEPATGIVRWTRDPGTSEQKTVAWGDLVRALHDGEVDLNLWDDNDNGLVDEAGLAFALVGEEGVRVQLSLERTSESGKQVLFALESMVNCRN
ncbi:MAG: prepilin-type N-terminal cleavage/methylation domain-containing protein [Planctomycetes bacterium]|nr:prepilin-type N-terminal cleavage/methylation domain-containing protein [Planctomycetota bacterium]